MAGDKSLGSEEWGRRRVMGAEDEGDDGRRAAAARDLRMKGNDGLGAEGDDERWATGAQNMRSEDDERRESNGS